MTGRLAAVVTAALALAACSSYQNPKEKLGISIHEYNEAVRWKSYRTASKHIPEAQRKTYLETRAKIGATFTILDYEIASVRYASDKEAIVTVVFNWLEMPDNTVHVSALAQRWVYGERRTWELTDQKKIDPKKVPRRVPVGERF